jgi:hypothetical protein
MKLGITALIKLTNPKKILDHENSTLAQLLHL